ncbi:MAG: hypothetical protein U5J83_12450 [Bryobacterales bacterium]|nr:hypothetical protein [Bryobacterales bacterium]
MMAFGILVVLMLALIAVGIAAVLWQIIYTAKHWRAAERLATALRWQALHPLPPAKPVWFGGRAQGRRAAIWTFGKGSARSVESGKPSASLALRVLMEVAVPRPIGVALRSREGVRAEAGFDWHFQGTGAERLHGPEREAMLEFVRKTYPLGVEGLHLRVTRRPRDLKVADRASISPDDVPPEVLGDAQVLLAHDHPGPHIPPRDLEQVLFEMASVAFAIESAVNQRR